MSVKTVTHRFNVWITVPAVSGDGWSKYPDYSADEMGRMIRRAIYHESGIDRPAPLGRACRHHG